MVLWYFSHKDWRLRRVKNEVKISAFAKDNGVKILEHSLELLEMFESFDKDYSDYLTIDEKKKLKLICKYHDLGKYNSKFQNIIRKKMKLNKTPEYGNKEIHHEILSIFAFSDYLINKNHLERKSLAEVLYIILTHHNRYQEFEQIIKYDQENLNIILENDFFNKIEALSKNFKEKVKVVFSSKKYEEEYLSIINLVKSYNQKKIYFDINNKEFIRYIKIKGLLNKLDYAASSLLTTFEISPNRDGMYLYEKILSKFDNQLRLLQEYTYEMAQKNPEKNLVVLASTGSGKTEASLLWGYRSKIIYTLPLKVAINNIFDRIKKNYSYDLVRLQHSGAYAYYYEVSETDEEYNRLKTESKLFLSPLTITTIDQLFGFVYLYELFEEQLVTLSYSKVIIDEIQMYEPKLVAIILVALKWITKMGGKFAIITATMPKIFLNLMDQLKIEYEMPNDYFKRLTKDGEEMIRHRIQLINKMKYEEILEKAKFHKILVMVNSVKKAQELYKSMKNNDKDLVIDLIHARYMFKDRKIKEKEIVEFSNNRKINGLWIATSIVEASIDIDFDIIYTELCTIDSLLQRLGRVYRNRDWSYDKEQANIFIALDENSTKITMENIDLFEYTKTALRKVIGNQSRLINIEEKQSMVDYVYDPEINKLLKDSLYYKNLIQEIDVLNCNLAFMTNKTKRDSIRDIYSISVIPLEMFTKIKNKGLVKEWKNKIKNGKYQEVKIQLEEYVVSIHGRHKKEKYCKAIEEQGFKYLFKDIFTCEKEYSKEIGLDL